MRSWTVADWVARGFAAVGLTCAFAATVARFV
jgi:hypothetical protein